MEKFKKTLESIFPQYQEKIKMYYVQEKQKLFKLDNFILIFFSNTCLVDLKYQYETKATEGCILISKDKNKFCFSFYPEWKSPEPYRWKEMPSDQEGKIISLVKLTLSKDYKGLYKVTEKHKHVCCDTYLAFSEDWNTMINEITGKHEPISVP